MPRSPGTASTPRARSSPTTSAVPSAQTIEAAATQAGVDLARARAAIATGAFDTHLEANSQLAAHTVALQIAALFP